MGILKPTNGNTMAAARAECAIIDQLRICPLRTDIIAKRTGFSPTYVRLVLAKYKTDGMVQKVPGSTLVELIPPTPAAGE